MNNNTNSSLVIKRLLADVSETFLIFSDSLSLINKPNYLGSHCQLDNVQGWLRFTSYDLVPCYLLPIAIIVIIVGSCLSTRKKPCDCCSHCGIFHPFDFLTNKQHKYILCVIFIVYGDVLFFSYIGSSADEEFIRQFTSEYKIVSKLYKIMQMGVYGTALYPLMSGLTHDHLAIRILTTLHAWLFFVLYLMCYVVVLICDENKSIRETVMPLPTLAALFILSVFYPYLVMMQLMKKPLNNKIEDPRIYVKSLFNCHRKRQEDLTVRKKVEIKLKEITRLRIAGFSYPPLFLATVTCMCSIVFQLMMYFLGAFIISRHKIGLTMADHSMKDDLSSLISRLKYLLTLSSFNNEQEMEFYERILLFLFYIQDAILICGIAGLTVAALYAYITIALIVLNFRRNQLNCMKNPSSSVNIVARNTKPSNGFLGYVFYSGYQTAYIVGGFILNSGIFILLFLIFTFAVVFPIHFGVGGYLLDILRSVLPPVGITISIMILHKLMAHFVFTDRNKTFRVTNRLLFFVYMHYMFFLNFLLGVFSLTFRVIKSSVAFFVLIARMDHSVMPVFFKKLDSPYFYYLRFIYVSVLHSSPILLSFLDCLKQSSHNKISSLHKSENYEMTATLNDFDCNSVYSPERVTSRSVIRWHLAYTLINNPELQLSRKRAIEERKKKWNQQNDELGGESFA